MKVGIFDPYLDTLGGGEKYIFNIASCLSDENDVFVFWDNEGIIKRASEKFNLNLTKVKTTKNIFSNSSFLFGRLINTKNYDVIFYVSDGSIPLLLSKKNFLIFQFPVNWVNGKNISTRLKLFKINKIICYSDFVKKYLDKTFSKNAFVLPPSIQISNESNIKKENIILNVGRFTKAMNTKKQDVLIKVFKKMCDSKVKRYKLILIGSVLPEDEDFIQALKKEAEGYPIDILTNISFQKLLDLYRKAKIYWHATGFSEDLEKHPEKAEHFGISTVEAMSQGAVPIVINAGGQKEIVENGKNGFLWDNLDQLIEKTEELTKNQNLWEEMSKKAKERAKNFNQEKFYDKIRKLVFI